MKVYRALWGTHITIHTLLLFSRSYGFILNDVMWLWTHCWLAALLSLLSIMLVPGSVFLEKELDPSCDGILNFVSPIAKVCVSVIECREAQTDRKSLHDVTGSSDTRWYLNSFWSKKKNKVIEETMTTLFRKSCCALYKK